MGNNMGNDMHSHMYTGEGAAYLKERLLEDDLDVLDDGNARRFERKEDCSCMHDAMRGIARHFMRHAAFAATVMGYTSRSARTNAT